MSVNGFAVTSSRMNYSRKVTYISRPRRRRCFFFLKLRVCVSGGPVCTSSIVQPSHSNQNTYHLPSPHHTPFLSPPHSHVHLALPPKRPELALTFSNEKGETTRWLITAAEAARLWSSMLLFTSPPSGNYEARPGRLSSATPASRWSFLDTIDTNDNEVNSRYSAAPAPT